MLKRLKTATFVGVLAYIILISTIFDPFPLCREIYESLLGRGTSQVLCHPSVIRSGQTFYGIHGPISGLPVELDCDIKSEG